MYLLWVKMRSQGYTSSFRASGWRNTGHISVNAGNDCGWRFILSYFQFFFLFFSFCKFPVFSGQLFQHLHHIHPDVIKHFCSHRISDTVVWRHGRKSVLTPRPATMSWFLFKTVLAILFSVKSKILFNLSIHIKNLFFQR